MRIPNPSIAPAWRRLTARLAVSTVILGLVAAVMPASAEDTCTVTVTPSDIIQDAINDAEDGHVICLGAGTFTEAVEITKPITLRGADHDGGTLLDVAGSAPGIEVTADDVTIADLRIEKDGKDGAKYGIEVNNTPITNLRIEGVTATGGTAGFKVGQGADIAGLTVVNSHFDGNRFGWYLAAFGGTTVTEVDVASSTFDDNDWKGIYAEKLEHAVFDGITVADSGTDAGFPSNDGISLNLRLGSFEDIEIRNATVTGSGLHGGTGITVKTGNDSGGALEGVTLSNVSVSGGSIGVHVGEEDETNAGPTDVTITGSSLSGDDGVALANTTEATINASGNWWDSVDGPTDGVTTGTVTTDPWCVDAACSALSDDAELTSLSLSTGTLSPSFSPSQTTYTANVGTSVTDVTVDRTVHPGGSTTVTGGDALAVGPNTIEVQVTSAGGVTRTYTITVTRAAPPPPPEPEPTPSPSPSPTPTPSPLPGEPVRTITEEVPAGGQVTTDPGGDGPSAEAPVQVALTSPTGGTVTIAESVAGGASEGWELVGRVLDITAPPATPEEPIVLDLAVDETVVDSDAPVAVFRDGVRVAACDDPAATVASPDPCVARRTAADGATSLTVRTSRASVWTIGVVDASTSELACPADETPRAGFGDVPDDATHGASIDCAAWHGIVHGTAGDGFDPQAPVSRGQMASFLARLLAAFGVDLPESPANPFTDSRGGVHAQAIAQLAELGIVTGTTPTAFGPGTAVSRAQTAALLVRTHELALGREAREADAGFEDVPGEGVHADAIRKLVRLRYSTGVTGTTFDPSAATSRAQAAAFLSRLLTRLVAEGLTL